MFVDLTVAKNCRETRFLHRRYRRTDRRTDRPSYRDAFLTDASKNACILFWLPKMSLLCKTGNDCGNHVSNRCEEEGECEGRWEDEGNV